MCSICPASLNHKNLLFLPSSSSDYLLWVCPSCLVHVWVYSSVGMSVRFVSARISSYVVIACMFAHMLVSVCLYPVPVFALVYLRSYICVCKSGSWVNQYCIGQ